MGSVRTVNVVVWSVLLSFFCCYSTTGRCCECWVNNIFIPCDRRRTLRLPGSLVFKISPVKEFKVVIITLPQVKLEAGTLHHYLRYVPLNLCVALVSFFLLLLATADEVQYVVVGGTRSLCLLSASILHLPDQVRFEAAGRIVSFSFASVKCLTLTVLFYS